MSIKLLVHTDEKTFNSYYYGYGTIECMSPDEVIINYGKDRYHAEYQEGRFASGLIFARLEEVN